MAYPCYPEYFDGHYEISDDFFRNAEDAQGEDAANGENLKKMLLIGFAGGLLACAVTAGMTLLTLPCF